MTSTVGWADFRTELRKPITGPRLTGSPKVFRNAKSTAGEIPSIAIAVRRNPRNIAPLRSLAGTSGGNSNPPLHLRTCLRARQCLSFPRKQVVVTACILSGAIGFDWVTTSQGGVSRLISWPRKKLITKQLPNRSFLSQPNLGCADLRIPAQGADRRTQIWAGIGPLFATADARLCRGLALDGLVRRTSPSRHNQRTTHVEALVQEQQDGGSIPPASIFGPSRK